MPRSTLFRSSVASVCAAAILLAATPVASAFVYWGNRESGNVGRANLDGSASNPSFIRLPPNLGASPCGIATDSAHIYWADINNDEIGRANIDGTSVDPHFIDTSGTGSEPCGLTIDGTHLYWSNKLAPGGIGRALIDGTSAQTLVSTTGGACGVAVDAAHVYWGETGTAAIGRADIGGSNPDHAFIPLADLTNCGIAVDASHLYFAEQGPAGGIARADLDGSNLNEGFVSGDDPCGVAVNANSIFWPEEIDETVAHANLDGSNPSLSFIGGADFPCGVALDSLSIPTCQDKSAATGHDQSLPLAIDCTGTNPLTYAISSAPHNGRIDSFDQGTGTFTYVPNRAFSGVDNFSYRATNAFGTSGIATATVSVAAAPPPSNRFSLGALRRFKRTGTASLVVNVPGPGRVALAGRGVRPANDETIDPGPVTLRVRSRGKALGRLRRRGSAGVRLTVTFTPLGGSPGTMGSTVRLIRRR
jgi:hypothetical protein